MPKDTKKVVKNSKKVVSRNLIEKIQKRSGELVPFDVRKIANAIGKAMQATKEGSKQEAAMVANKVFSDLVQMTKKHPDFVPTVEGVQNMVEKELMISEYVDTAKAYILYREQHKQLRDITSQMNNGLMDKYLSRADWLVKENSNMAYSLQGLNNYIASEISKNYWLNKIYPSNIREAHNSGDFHIHDLNILSVYCVGWDLMDLLMQGFTGVAGKISSKPPKHFRSALGQVVNFFYTLQGESAGAQAFSNFDTLLAPFIRYDKLTYEEVKKDIQTFLFNVNVPTRVGFQTPFTNITLDLTVPKHYAKQSVIIGGKSQKETYGDFQKEMDMFNKAFFEVASEGDASGRVFTFPIPTVNVTKDFSWDSEVSKLLWQVTGKYGLPYFSNFINSDMDPEDARSMCCRLRIDNRQLEYRGGGLFGANPLTGSIGVVTINLPRIGIEAKNKRQFFSLLKEKMILAKESLEIKRKVLEKFTDQNLYPYTKFYLRSIKETYGSYWKNHFSTIGLVGMNEAIRNLFGEKENVGTEKGKAFSVEVLEFMRSELVKFQAETGSNYNLEATPAEGVSYRLPQLDKKKYGDKALFANGQGNETERPFYTNSTHLPVNYTDDVFEALDIQDNIQTKYTGGTVLHMFLGEQIQNTESVKGLVKKICQNYRLPYFTFTPTFSVCPTHGYISGQMHTCDRCGNSCEVYSRIVGYLRPVSQWNEGKQAEFDIRKTYVTEKKPASVMVVAPKVKVVK
jgi:ribonucleoside-triphosphate reductase